MGQRTASAEVRANSKAWLKRAALAGASALAITSAAHAQQSATSPAHKDNGPTTVEEVVVTATRLTTAGFDAPTPTTAVGQDFIQKSAAPNVFQTVIQLPSLQGSTGTAVNNGNTSSGLNGLSAFSVRGLGTIRTLTLIDGQRIVPAYLTGIADVSQLPQLLIQRVDVVTGGASASYGSDAVGGVVNFITMKKFEGLKLNLQGGETNYGDEKTGLFQIAAGKGFLDERLHVEASGEYFKDDGIPARLPGDNGGVNGRDWYTAPGYQQLTIAQTPAGSPQYHFVQYVQNVQYSAYGLITSGPLQGIAFGPGGAPYNFQYGSNGVPTHSASGAVTNCGSTQATNGGALACVGGERAQDVSFTSSMDGALARKVGYARISYDLGPKTELFATINLADVTSHNQPNAGAAKQSNLTIQCTNPFLPESIAAACAANGITSFKYGTSNIFFPAYIDIASQRQQHRFVVGLNSELHIFGKPWTFQSYYEHGENITDIHISNITLTPRYNAAIDAVDINGQIVCRSTVARAAGCVPLNIIGLNPIDPAAWAYIAPANGPYSRTFERQEAASVALSGTPLKNWAGDVSVAAGAEYREEFYKTRGDVYGNGADAISGYSSAYPSDPVLSSAGNNWYAGNFHNGGGRYDVREVFAEVGMPLFNNDTLGKFDLDVAGRETDYSTSGWVSTWKVGGVWDTPIEGVRLRAVRSRDVRAPNLSELFAAKIVQNGTVTDRRKGTGVLELQTLIGNPNLKPEQSDNFEAGVVYHPPYIPGFDASVDFYSVKINQAIASLSPQQIVDLCQISHNNDFCGNIYLDGSPGTANPSFVIVQPFNLASIRTRGVDIEAAYQFDLHRFHVPGHFTVRGLATHVIDFVTSSGIPGQPEIDSAGSNFGGNIANGAPTPNWKALLLESWSWNDLTLNATERVVSDGTINADWIECQAPNCPAPTIQHPTIDYNKIPGATYLDLGGSYRLHGALEGGEVYFKIDNVFDKNPPPLGNEQLYDWFGRVMRVGFRFSR